MKVGTDGVLLGAWCMQGIDGDRPLRVLDVGTGSGLIALMVAQRFASAQITAIDIDEAAVEQARENFARSPWHNRLNALLCPFSDLPPDVKYDAIVSNPPYFVDSLLNPSALRTAARHAVSLSLDTLIQGSALLLEDCGTLSLVLPAEQEKNAVAVAASCGLVLRRLTKVFTKQGKPQKRSLMEWQKSVFDTALQPVTDTLVLMEDNAPRSEKYAALTKDFYL